MRLHHVHKRYGRGHAVLAGISVEIPESSLVAVVGANGSGKTTLLRIMAGAARPSAGFVTDRPSDVGYLPDRFPARLRLTVRSYLRHMAAIRGIDATRAAAQAEEMLGQLHCVAEWDTPMAKLSKGNAQKVGLVQALCGPPELLILDEPWSGLDAEAMAALESRLVDLVRSGARAVVAEHTGWASSLPGALVYQLADGLLVPMPGGAGLADSELAVSAPVAGTPIDGGPPSGPSEGRVRLVVDCPAEAVADLQAHARTLGALAWGIAAGPAPDRPPAPATGHADPAAPAATPLEAPEAAALQPPEPGPPEPGPPKDTPPERGRPAQAVVAGADRLTAGPAWPVESDDPGPAPGVAAEGSRAQPGEVRR